MPNQFEFRTSDAATRPLKASPLPGWGIGVTTDEHEMFFGSQDTPIGRPIIAPQAPKSAVDVRRLFGFASQGQQDTYTDVSAVAQDASGMLLSPKPHLAAGTDVVTTGYILPYELADGGTITIEAVGTYHLGSIIPRLLANLKIGGAYVRPQYEQYVPNAGTPSAPTDLTGLASSATNDRPFEWSIATIGLNALAGYEALNVAATNLTQGEFQWRLSIKIHALGRWAKWQRFNNSGTGATGTGARDGTKDRNCWVEATLEWGALHHNAGARIGEGQGYYNPTAAPNIQYQPTLPAGVVRGCIYSFMGTQWLCHAGSATNALTEAADPDTLDATIWTQMLMEEAPGMGVHWRDFFVPAVSKATISGFADVDWTVGNEIQLELGGPQQVDLGTTFAAYNAASAYLPEGSTCSAAGINYVAKTFILQPTAPKFVAGTSDTTAGVATFTAAPTGAANSDRCWRALPATLRDTMRVQHCHGYLYGRRNGVAEKRV